MTRRFLRSALLVGFALAVSPARPGTAQSDARISLDDLRDKIKGGWAGQTIGVTFGGPTEFRFNGTMIQDYTPIPWYDGKLKETFVGSPGLYDDIYMDLTFVDVLEKQGLDAPAAAFADAFAHAEYMLWHANQMARYNILNGIAPPESGHWLNNPEADDIDFQIEADFAGLMNPGMPNAASEVCDTVGHIMNSGDGYYGGVFIAAMYALAFVDDNVERVVEQALRTIPEESTFYRTIHDVIGWHRQFPDDWKRTWFEVQRNWSEDVGCPDGVFQAFNIDAKINAAYVVLGLLYGDGDFGKTIDIATRAGQDSDCNPASAGGILGTILGYEGIPAYWKQGLADVEPLDFKYTTISLDDVYRLSFEHALEQIRRNGGVVDGDHVTIKVEPPVPVALEQNFEGHVPVDALRPVRSDDGSYTFSFEGIGFTVRGAARSEDGGDHVIQARLLIDGSVVETVSLPTRFAVRKFVPFWRYRLAPGRHEVRVELVEPVPGARLDLEQAVIYAEAPRPGRD